MRDHAIRPSPGRSGAVVGERRTATTVLHVIDSDGMYGAESMLLELASEQRRQGVRAVVCSLGLPASGEKSIEAAVVAAGLEAVPLRGRNGPNPAMSIAILREAKRLEAGIIHSHGYKGNILLSAVPRRLRHRPLVTTLHGRTAVDGFSRLRLYYALESLLWRGLDGVVAVEDGMVTRFRLSALGMPCAVIPNGIPSGGPSTPAGAAASRASEFRDFARGAFLIGGIGRLSPEKGFVGLVESLERIRREGLEARLVLLGEGPERARLEMRVADLGLQEHVLIAGFVPQVRCLLRCFDVIAVSSLTEGLPMIVLEAMAEGVPVVATRVGGLPEVLGEGLWGILVEPGNPADMSRGIQEVRARPEEARARATGALRRVESRYSSREMVRRYSTFYETVLESSRFRALK